jgi:hypothetical protein
LVKVQAPPVEAGSGTPSAPVGVREDGVVVLDRPCVMCGYSLLGLSQDGVCPECATPVERSLRGALLKHCSPSYLRMLHRGVFYGEMGVALRAAASAGLVFVMYGPMSLTQQTLIQILDLVLAAVPVVGWWMFTTPDPASADARERQARRFVRVMLGILVGVEALMFGFSYVPVFRTTVVAAAGGGGPGAWFVFMMIRSFLTSVVDLIGMIALGSYLRALARRVPSQVLYKRAGLYRWLIPLLIGLGMPGIFCCPTLLARLTAIVLTFVLLEPWRWTLRRLRREQEMEDGVQAV